MQWKWWKLRCTDNDVLRREIEEAYFPLSSYLSSEVTSSSFKIQEFLEIYIKKIFSENSLAQQFQRIVYVSLVYADIF